jgi:hypothetical protein
VLGAAVMVLIAIIVIVFLGPAAIRWFRPPIRVNPVRSDLRSMATALESYFAEHRAYPPMVMARALSANAANSGRGALDYRTFALMLPPPGLGAHGLTTPVAYLTAYFPDPFAATRGDTFAYFTDGGGWILVSPGPDGDFDLMMDEGDLDYSERNDTIERVYDSSVPQPSLALRTGAGPRGAFTYDPTNGTGSSGDVWRVKK